MPTMSEVNRPVLSLAAALGAIGVAAAAYASHAGKAELAIAANFLLLHAPVLLGIALIKGNRFATLAIYVLLVALLLFAGDLAMRDLTGLPLFPFAAPLGGAGLILGWVVLAASAWTGR
jgi:uncharacterized membrane protein YgdD (TMEM256/DUF423 family)